MTTLYSMIFKKKSFLLKSVLILGAQSLAECDCFDRIALALNGIALCEHKFSFKNGVMLKESHSARLIFLSNCTDHDLHSSYCLFLLLRSILFF